MKHSARPVHRWGVVQNLSAIALSIKPGGSAEHIKIEGGSRLTGPVSRLEQQGIVKELTISGGFGVSEDHTASAGH